MRREKSMDAHLELVEHTRILLNQVALQTFQHHGKRIGDVWIPILLAEREMGGDEGDEGDEEDEEETHTQAKNKQTHTHTHSVSGGQPTVPLAGFPSR
jgi:hypothetical protein